MSLNLTDEELVGVIREKDQELYSEIIERYKKKLSNYLRKFIYDADELEDVLQAVFIKVYKNLYAFNVKKKFSSWIYRIAHNEAINHIKKNSRIKLSIDDIEYKLVDEKIDLGKDMDRSILKEKMEENLSKLKQKYRDVLVLYYFEEKTYEEISDILKMPRNTVGTLISRGKKILKDDIVKNSSQNIDI